MSNNPIHWLVDRYHVGESDRTIAKDILRRSLAAGHDKETRKQLARIAIARHQSNRKIAAL